HYTSRVRIQRRQVRRVAWPPCRVPCPRLCVGMFGGQHDVARILIIPCCNVPRHAHAKPWAWHPALAPHPARRVTSPPVGENGRRTGAATGPNRSRFRRGDATSERKPVDADAIVKLLGGIGMFLLGIHHLTEGLKGLSGDSLRRTLQRIVSARFSAVA